jgi:hypothetical protein
VRHALGRRQQAGAVLDQEVPQGEHDLDGEQRGEQPGECAPPFAPAEGGEDDGVDEIAQAVEAELARGGGPPGQALGEFVVVERVKGAEGDLQREREEQSGHDVPSA